jgi:hypothetical protein
MYGARERRSAMLRNELLADSPPTYAESLPKTIETPVPEISIDDRIVPRLTFDVAGWQKHKHVPVVCTCAVS